MGWIKNLFSKFRNKKVTKEIEQTTQIGQSEQKKFDEGLRKSSGFFQQAINEAVASRNLECNAELYEKIEDMLILMDIGTAATNRIMDSIKDELAYQKTTNADLIKKIIIDKIFVYYIQDSFIDNGLNIKLNTTNVILISGVNGVGKTTSIAKLAYNILQKNMTVCLIAADTYRAGAVEQLGIWADRLKINIFKPKITGQDPSSVIYEGLKWANENKIDVVLCDTSGRIQTKTNLMNELKKMDGVIRKFNPDQPCESLLVLDATTGQSGISQAKVFSEVTKLSGIILTKMDGTSKGGIILAIKDNFNIPVKFIGVGEKYEDLQVFDLEKYILGLLQDFDIDEDEEKK